MRSVWIPVVMLPALSAISLFGQASPCPSGSNTITFGMNDVGKVHEGTVCVEVSYNALRYTLVLNDTVSQSAGPTLQPTAPTTGGGPPPESDSAVQLKSDLRAAEIQLAHTLQQDDARAVTLNNDLAILKTAVDSSDAAFASGGSKSVLDLIASPTVAKARDDGNKSSDWEGTEGIIETLNALKIRAAKLEAAAVAGSQDKADMQAASAKIGADIAKANDYTVSGTKATAYQTAHSIFVWWDLHFTTVSSPASFVAQYFVQCNIINNTNENNTVKVSGLDNLHRFSDDTATPLTVAGNVATVNCSSPFSISAGLAVSFLKSPTYGFVPSGTSGTNQFGITDTGGTNPMPIAMVHWRLWPWGDKAGMYGSFGTAAHVQSQSSGGSAAEYLTGLSVGLYRSAFVSFGWHLGKVSSLNGGYKVGDTVPNSVTTVPVTSSYQSGFGLAITFTKP